jgi:hypothetical protein
MFAPNELRALGLSVVKAMASRLIPVVHRSRGPWRDVMDSVVDSVDFFVAVSNATLDFSSA